MSRYYQTALNLVEDFVFIKEPIVHSEKLVEKIDFQGL